MWMDEISSFGKENDTFFKLYINHIRFVKKKKNQPYKMFEIPNIINVIYFIYIKSYVVLIFLLIYTCV
jgi:hypothetical protein